MKKITYYIFGLSVWVLLVAAFCDPEPCEIPITKTIGINDTFSISPLKSVYNVGDKINIKFIVDNIAKLESDTNKDFNLFKNTRETLGKILDGITDSQDLANLIYNSSVNSIKIIFGEEYNNGGLLVLKYNSNLKKYLLELEVTLLSKRSYNLKDFSFILTLGYYQSSWDNKCHFYEHKSSIIINPNISFEVK